MKSLITKIGIMVAAISIVCSCTTDKSGSQESKNYYEFIEQSQIGVYDNDVPLKQFDQTTEQVVFDSRKSFYMVSTMDNSSCYTLSFDGRMYLDQVITVDYNNKNIEKIGSGSISATVIKVETSSLTYWLWNSELKIGFIVGFEL